MLYLATQMLLFLVAASLMGVIIGWWLAKLNKQEEVEPILEDEDIYALKYRLDKCFDDNATLRNNLKQSHNKIDEISREQTVVAQSTDSSFLQEKIDVLMEDLEMRDDTISALEKELERVKVSQ